MRFANAWEPVFSQLLQRPGPHARVDQPNLLTERIGADIGWAAIFILHLLSLLKKLLVNLPKETSGDGFGSVSIPLRLALLGQ